MKLRFLFLAMLTVASAARAAFSPVVVDTNRYNADVVVESSATPVLKVVTTASLDNGTNGTADTWMEVGNDPGNPGFGFPHPNTTFTAISNANYSFKTAPSYTGANNGILVDGNGTSTGFNGGTFTVTTPTAYVKLSFLGSGGNGGDNIGVTVHHLDGTTETYRPVAGVTNNAYIFGCPDWFNGTVNVAWIANERMNASSHTFDNVNSGNPRLYFRDIALTNTTSAVTSIDLVYVNGASGSHNDIVGVSGSTDGITFNPIDVTGYTFDFVIENTAAIRGRLVSTTILDGTNAWAVTQTFDNNAGAATGFTFYERGYNFNNINNGPATYNNAALTAIAQSTGLPPGGSTITNGAGDHIFTFAPSYTTNDVFYLSPVQTNVNIPFLVPTNASALSFLAAAGNGPVKPMVVVNFIDGTSETNTITVVDWFDGSTPVFIPGGRVQADAGQFSQVVSTGLNNSAGRLFAADMSIVNAGTLITNLTLIYTNTGGRMPIFAVSAISGPLRPFPTLQPVAVRTYPGSNVTFTTTFGGTLPISYQWQRGTNGVYVDLTDGGNISGATTTTLSVNTVDLPDDADYRTVASNTGGFGTNTAAHLTVLDTNACITAPGDSAVSAGGPDASGEEVTHAIDNLTSKWLNFGGNGGTPFLGPVSVTLVPSAITPSIVTAIRFYTANDTPARDPADFKLEGSNNGGSSYTLIASNALALPDDRNAAGLGKDPLAQALQQLRVSTTNGYTSYRVTINHVKSDAGANSMQIGEIELVGVVDTNPVVRVNVTNGIARAYEQGTLTIGSLVTGPSAAVQWQRKVSGNFVNLTDGGPVSGAQTTVLTVSPTSFSDATDYRIIATNSISTATSGVVTVAILTTNVDVTSPSDTVVDFGDLSAGFFGTPTPGATIDNTFSGYINGGSGLNAAAGFPPWSGPAGVIITPSVGFTLVTGIRFYAGTGGNTDDPADFVLAGSSDGGTTFTTIASGGLSLPNARNQVADALDPLSSSMQEVLFPNTHVYNAYRITVNNTRDNNLPNGQKALRIGEIELLGIATVTPPPTPVITSIKVTGGNVILSGTNGSASGTFYVLTSTNITLPLSNWTSIATNSYDGSGNFAVTNAVGGTRQFYSIHPIP